MWAKKDRQYINPLKWKEKLEGARALVSETLRFFKPVLLTEQRKYTLETHPQVYLNTSNEIDTHRQTGKYKYRLVAVL